MTAPSQVKVIIFGAPVEGTYTTPAPVEDAGDTDAREFAKYRPQFYFRALDDGTTDDEPHEGLVLLFTNTRANLEGQDAFTDLTLKRGVTDGVPSHTPVWTDLKDSDPGVTLMEAEDAFLF